jgi:hypothetical protein
MIYPHVTHCKRIFTRQPGLGLSALPAKQLLYAAATLCSVYIYVIIRLLTFWSLRVLQNLPSLTLPPHPARLWDNLKLRQASQPILAVLSGQV